ncbi:MAG TPA: tRNA (adenosine(37)-N6)-threonylcarbamoyltransferase complex dimerization subunit type 1 TsaB [Solirubrobacteraceae bacterium]|jgi:tRNA threonylcarbamoyladenosine biosynthesis protein TsaB|nr:tRNA (adenosine(37)-N6)-threonylcarbamoyltransferase complex dimerization subunit type 1 TsaB [Solirubrobacteraceae bacterium]
MTILGFDTSTPATAVALRSSDGTTLRAYDEAAPGGRPSHTSRLLALTRELLAQAGADWGEVERIAVGVGPGTFTGLRVGIATARGLAQSLGAELVGVGSLRVLAQAALRDGVTTHAAPQNVLAMIDARRGEAFLAACDAQAELVPPCALPPQRLAALVAELGTDREWVAVGDGALRFQGDLEALAVVVPADASPLHRIDAGVLCELAADAPAGDPGAVLPDYRRRPDAEIALEGGGAAPDPHAASVRMNPGSKS